MCPKGFFEDQFIGQFRALAKFAREFGYVEGQSSLWTSMSLHNKRIALGKIHFEGIFIYHLSHYSRIQ